MVHCHDAEKTYNTDVELCLQTVLTNTFLMSQSNCKIKYIKLNDMEIFMYH